MGGNLFDQFKKKTRDELNSVQEDALTKMTDHASKIGSQLKFDLNLDSFKGLDLSFPDVDLGSFNFLKDKLNNYVNTELNSLRNGAADTLKELVYVGKDYLANLMEKGLELFTSRIYLADVIYLISVKAMIAMGSNPTLYNYAIRTIFAAHDMILCLTYVDDFCGLSLYYDDHKSRAYSTGLTASNKSAPKVVEYALQHMSSDMKRYNKMADSDEAFLAVYKKSLLQEEFDDLNNKIESTDDPDEKLALMKQQESVVIKQDYSSKRYAERDLNRNGANYIERDYLSYRRIASTLHKKCITLIKNLIVKGYTNIDHQTIYSLMKMCEVTPTVFGTKDDVYNSAYYIDGRDIEILAPFYDRHEFDITNNSHNDIGRYSKTDQYFIDKDTDSQGFVENLKDSLGDTRLVQTSKIQNTYIDPRNLNIKKIYLMLVNTSIWGEETMFNKELRERLSYPIQSVLLSALDDAAKNLANTGLGKKIVDTLLTIDQMLYKTTKDYEKSFFDPSTITYLQIATDSTSLPPLTYDTDIEIVDDDSYSVAQKNYLETIQYYLQYLQDDDKIAYYKYVLEEINILYPKILNEEYKNILKLNISRYVSPDFFHEDFTIDNYLSTIRITNIDYRLPYLLTNIRYPDEDLVVDEESSSLIEDFSYKMYQTLVNNFVRCIANDFMTISQMREYSLFIFNKMVDSRSGVVEIENRTLIADYLNSVYEYGDSEADLFDFDIETWLINKNEDVLKNHIIDAIFKIIIFRDSLDPNDKEHVIIIKDINNILDETLPPFKVNVDGSVGDDNGDIDINNPDDGLFDDLTPNPPLNYENGINNTPFDPSKQFDYDDLTIEFVDVELRYTYDNKKYSTKSTYVGEEKVNI